MHHTHLGDIEEPNIMLSNLGPLGVTNLATTSWYFHPTSWLSLPTVQYFLPGFNLNTLNACGTTILFFLSYGGGTPSKTLRRSIAAAPRAVLWGIMPRTVL